MVVLNKNEIRRPRYIDLFPRINFPFPLASFSPRLFFPPSFPLLILGLFKRGEGFRRRGKKKYQVHFQLLPSRVRPAIHTKVLFSLFSTIIIRAICGRRDQEQGPSFFLPFCAPFQRRPAERRMGEGKWNGWKARPTSVGLIIWERGGGGGHHHHRKYFPRSSFSLPCFRVCSVSPRAGNETVSSRKKARRDETRPSRSRLVS